MQKHFWAGVCAGYLTGVALYLLGRRDGRIEGYSRAMREVSE